MGDGKLHTYCYAGGRLLREVYGNTVLDFAYDASGNPFSLTYNGTKYYYVTNLQGDVYYLVDTNGNTAAAYTYDPFGKVLTASGSLAEINPLRYRGYYYDTETGFYYLQSRYYDPTICRFINADVYASTGQGFVGNNMFAYCDNNPVRFDDQEGALANWIVGAIVGGIIGGIAALATGGDITDVVIGTLAGAASGAIIAGTGNVPLGRAVGSAVNATGTYIDARINGAGETDALLAYAASFAFTYGASTISGFAGDDTFAVLASDCVFGMGAGLICAGAGNLAVAATDTVEPLSPSTTVTTYIETNTKWRDKTDRLMIRVN